MRPRLWGSGCNGHAISHMMSPSAPLRRQVAAGLLAAPKSKLRAPHMPALASIYASLRPAYACCIGSDMHPAACQSCLLSFPGP